MTAGERVCGCGGYGCVVSRSESVRSCGAEEEGGVGAELKESIGCSGREACDNKEDDVIDCVVWNSSV